jgi:hypothetical protein
VTEEIISDDDRRAITGWAAGCAERVLPLFEAAAPADPRPGQALAGARAYAAGGDRKGDLRTLAFAALAAARETGDPAATAAARAAGYAASAPYIHSLVTPHQSKHIHAPVIYAALARELADGDPAAGDAEIAGAIAQVPGAVREVARRLPAFTPGRSRLDALRHVLDVALRETE